MVSGDSLLPHAEAVAAFGLHMQFGGLVRRGPLIVELDAIGSKVELVVRRGGQKQGRGVGGDRSIFHRGGGGIDGCDKRRTACGSVPKAGGRCGIKDYFCAPCRMPESKEIDRDE